MRWLAVTVALLTASAALVAGIFLRDRSTSWRLPPPRAAAADAQMVLTWIAGPYCGNRCSYRLLAHPRTDHWLALIVDRSRPQCVDINLDTFDISDPHGVAGLTSVRCDTIAAAGGVQSAQ
jgi:hypothetical protein